MTLPLRGVATSVLSTVMLQSQSRWEVTMRRSVLVLMTEKRLLQQCLQKSIRRLVSSMCPRAVATSIVMLMGGASS